MLKYTTYKSIYDMPEPSFSSSLLSRILDSGLGKGTVKLLLFLLLLTITGTGVVSAFASGGSSEGSTASAIVVVHSGDTLWEIAASHKPTGTDTRVYVEAIKRHNSLHSSGIQAGSTLELP